MKIFAAVMLLLIFAPGALGQTPYTNWDLRLRASTSTQNDSLAKMGVRTDASADFENVYDTPRPPRSPSGTYLEVYFPHSGGSYPPILGTRYATDFQGIADPTWNLSVECSVPGALTLLWDSSYVNAIEPRVQLFLVDVLTGAKVNMRIAGRYSFNYTTKRDFQVVGAVKVDLTYLMEGFWNGSTQAQDTVTGYLADGAGSHAIVDSARVVLSSSGKGLLLFQSAPTSNYYVVIHHRNHLAVWSALSQALTKGTTSISPYDFSAGAATAFGTDPLKNEGGIFVAWSGDVNQDGVIDFLDRNIAWNNRTLPGYLPSDCNGDNVTDGIDYSLVMTNRLKISWRP
jgi:hypothetical protein